MTAVKIAISLPPETLSTAKKAVRDGHAPSMSALVAEALDRMAERESLEAFVRDLHDASGGPATTAERRWAREQLDGQRGASSSRRPSGRSRAR
jgi:Arc/MetJ-type ribon-helix-helix transcriptional regulator